MSEVLGLSEVLAGLIAAREVIEHAATDEGLTAAGDEIRRAWVANIESEGLVLTGRYRDSITVERDGAETKVVTDVPYAPILEHGDSRQDAHPVAQRAFDEHASEAIEHVGRAIEQVIR